MSRVVICNTRLADGDEPRDLYFKDGLIEGINLGGPTDESFEAEGTLALPAFIDLHAHLREPGQVVKEDLSTGLSAATAGGYGTVISMANTEPPIDEPGLVAELITRSENLGKARLRPAASLSRGMAGTQLTDFAALKQAGAVMITDDGIPVEDSHLMRRACEYAAELDLVIQTHSEDPSLRGDGVINEGEVSHRLGLPGNPISAEVVMIARDCEIAHFTGSRVHIAHVSSRRGMQVIRAYKAEGAKVTAEVTPHHLTLTDKISENFDPINKVAPPLRGEEDVKYLQSTLSSGEVDCIGTDHAPHTLAEKQRDFLEAPFGIANIEVAFPLLYTRLVTTGILELTQLVHLLTTGPAKVMGWPKPNLQPGSPADVTFVDLDNKRAVKAEAFKSRAKFSPWDGDFLKGWPFMTFVRGQKAYSCDT